MKKNIRYVMLAIIAGLFATNMFAAKYLNPAPISNTVNVAVGEVKEGTVLVPIITWGGDIATVLANGNSLATAKGSIFESRGLKVTLQREDVFTKQVERYVRGESPYLRGTMDQIGLALELLNKDPRTKPITIYQLTWSRGGDCLVVKANIKSAADLKGKTIALQAYGPHIGYLVRVLTDAGLSVADVNIKWVRDITGPDESPAAAFADAGVDAAFVISPDAAALTSNMTVGTGAEGSVRGARLLLSTKTANRIISDVYVVRQDYFNAHRPDVEKFVHGLLLAQEKLDTLMSNSSAHKAEYDATLAASGSILLDNAKDPEGPKGLYADCEFVGYQGNVKFFSDGTFQRRLGVMNDEVQTALTALSLVHSKSEIAQAGFDYEVLKNGLTQTAAVTAPKFQQAEVQKVIGQKADQGVLENSSIFSFEIFFQPNQKTFNADTYRPEFKKVVDLAAVYGGAVITVEGHSDPMGYLKRKHAGENPVALGMIKQSAKNLSLARAAEVRDALVEFAKQSGIPLDPSQFAVVGYGITHPKTGLIGDEPKMPATQAEWLSNMRVEFRLVSVEAEESVFTPIGGAK